MTTRFTVEVLINAKNNAGAALKGFKDGFTGALAIPTSIGEAFERLGGSVGNLVAQLPALAAQTLKLGVQAEASSLRFERFAGGADKAAELLDAFQVAADGSVDKLAAMEGTTKLLSLGVVETSEELGTMAAIAVRLGDQTASASARIADFGALLANQSIPRLDNFGISSGRVRARIKELQAQTADLSREEAFKIAVMEEGRKSLDLLGNTTETASFKMQKLQAAVKDAQVGLGELGVKFLDTNADIDSFAARIRGLPGTIDEMLSLTSASIGFLATLGVTFGDTEAATETFNSVLAELSTGLSTTDQAILSISVSSSEMMENIKSAGVATAEEEAAMAALTERLSRVIIEQQGVSESQEEMDIALRATTADIEANRLALEAQTAAAQTAALTQIELAEGLKGASEAQIASAAINQLKNALDAGEISFEDYTTAVGEVQLAFGLADEASVNLAERMTTLVERLGTGTVSAEDFDTELQLLVAIQQAEVKQLELFGQTLTGSNVTVTEASLTTQTYGEAVDVTTKSVNDFTGETLEARDAVAELSNRLDSIPREIDVTINVRTRGNVPGGEGFQRGTAFAPGGFAMVGEGGPEMMFVPRGAQIAPADVTSNVTNNNLTMNVTSTGGPGAAIQDFNLLRSLAQ